MNFYPDLVEMFYLRSFWYVQLFTFSRRNDSNSHLTKLTEITFEPVDIQTFILKN